MVHATSRRRALHRAALLVASACALAASQGCECESAGEPSERRSGPDETRGGEEDPARGGAERMLPREAVDVPEPARFEVVDPALAEHAVRARGWAGVGALRGGGGGARLSVGNWLCRIQTHYGPPGALPPGGFFYAFRDTETRDIISAYSDETGPALGGVIHGDDGLPMFGAQARVTTSIEAFVRLMEATEPRDCDLTLETQLGRIRVGVQSGEWFEEELE